MGVLGVIKMKRTKNILLATLFLLNTSIAFSQTDGFKEYSYNPDYNNKLNFSFEIPESWIISTEFDGTGYLLNCTPEKKNQIEEFDNCFEGAIFKIKYYEGNLETALNTIGLIEQKNGVYLKNAETIEIVVTHELNGETYDGLYYLKLHDIVCEDEKIIKGQFQFIFFSDGKQTICLETMGKKLDENVLNRIERTFKYD